jgi:hypothetical protein
MSDTDQQVRTLFTDAAGDVPPGIDLLHGFRVRRAARRVRGRVALGAAAASLVAAVTAVTLTITTAPSALAEVTSAASRTAGLSYDITATVAAKPLRAGSGVAVSGQISGSFDPAQKIGETTLRSAGGDGQMRFIGPSGRAGTPRRQVLGKGAKLAAVGARDRHPEPQSRRRAIEPVGNQPAEPARTPQVGQHGHPPGQHVRGRLDRYQLRVHRQVHVRTQRDQRARCDGGRHRRCRPARPGAPPRPGLHAARAGIPAARAGNRRGNVQRFRDVRVGFAPASQ